MIQQRIRLNIPVQLNDILKILRRRIQTIRQEPNIRVICEVLRCCRRIRNTPQAQQINLPHPCRILKIHILNLITVRHAILNSGILMLMIEIFLRLRKPDSRESRLEERLVVAAAEETIWFVDERDIHLSSIGSTSVDFLDKTAQVPGWCVVLVTGCDEFFDDGGVYIEVVGPGAEDADSVLVLGGEGGVGAAADDVVVEICLDVDGCVLHCGLSESSMQ